MRGSLIALAALLLAAAAPHGDAAAQVVEYTSQSAFDAATQSLSIDNFSSYAQSNFASLATSNAAVLTASGGSSPHIGITGGTGNNQYGTGQFAFAGNALALNAAMPGGTTAIAANFNLSGAGTVIVNTTSGSQSFSVPNPGQNQFGYAGFVSGSAITSVSYISNSGFPEDIDNLALGHAQQGSNFSVSVSGLSSGYTLSNAVLLDAVTTTGGQTINETIPMGAIADGGGLGPPPPVFVPIGDGQIASQSINVMAEYTTSSATGVALLVAEGVGVGAPPPVLTGTFGQTFVTTGESNVLTDLQNLNSGGSSAPNLDNFMENNPGFMFQVGANSSISDGSFYAYSGGTQIGSLNADVLLTPEPSSLVLLAIGSAALWLAARRRPH